MADYFTHFSCLLDVGTPENAARALDLFNALSKEGASEEPPSDGFLLSIQPEHGSTKLWMRDDVTGDPERLIQFVKRCATEFGLTGRWGFQYANTCSRPRLDGFGGTITNAAVRTPGAWSVEPTCGAFPPRLPGCNASCEWTLRADLLDGILAAQGRGHVPAGCVGRRVRRV